MISRKFVLILAIFCFAFSCFPSVAQESPETAMELFPRAVGFNTLSYSDDIFFGLDYQQWTGNFGFSFYIDTQFTFLSSFQYQISKSRFSNPVDTTYDFSTGLFLFADLGLTSVTVEEGTEPDIPFQIVSGAGMGIEVVLYDHFSWVTKIGYTVLYPNNPSFGLSMNHSLQYRF